MSGVRDIFPPPGQGYPPRVGMRIVPEEAVAAAVSGTVFLAGPTSLPSCRTWGYPQTCGYACGQRWGVPLPDSPPLTAQALWSGSTDRLISATSAATYKAWLSPTRPVSLEDGTLTLAVPNSFVRSRIQDELYDPVVEVLRDVLGAPVTLRLVVDPDLPPPSAPVAVIEHARTATPDSDLAEEVEFFTSDDGLSQKYTFENFVIGESNRLAHHAARAVAEQPAQVYNPLFLHGDAGLGKTHLLNAIGNAVKKLYPRKRVEYVTSETFINDFITAIRYDRTPQFKARYRSVDVLLVDDIQFLGNSERTQEEFFHTFNELHNNHKQMAFSSDQPPGQLGSLEDRLRSRLSWGLITDIQAPDLETRIAILRRKADSERVEVPDEVLSLIASRCRDNIRELEGALNRVVAYASLDGVPITIDLAEAELQGHLFEEARPITPQTIIEATARYFNLSPEQLLSSKRLRPLVDARQVAMYICRELTDLSLPAIGEAFGGKDHTTVLHAVRKINDQMKQKRKTLNQVNDITAMVRSCG